MPIDYKNYPANWEEIRNKILRRAGGREDDPKYESKCESCGAMNYKPHPQTGARVVLTIAHIYDPDPHNVNDDNLLALCQKCHNNLDAPMRARNRALARRISQKAAGQLSLF